MRAFITVSVILDALKTNRNRTASPRMEDAPKFLEWTVGFIVKHKNGSETYKIVVIEGEGYQGKYWLAGTEDPEDKRSLRGGTLQSSYVFVSRGNVEDPELRAKTTQPMTVATDCIKTFAPRKENRPGSRLVLKDRVSYAVLESHEDIRAMIGPVTGTDSRDSEHG